MSLHLKYRFYQQLTTFQLTTAFYPWKPDCLLKFSKLKTIELDTKIKEKQIQGSYIHQIIRQSPVGIRYKGAIDHMLQACRTKFSLTR